jgi:tRNA 5-methylaminomethyl-2-thiouridine biosynthesis bifunctional protein
MVRMPPKATSPLQPDWAWDAQPAWTVLDTDYAQGQHFEATLHAWRANPQRPRMLHYVGLLGESSAPTGFQRQYFEDGQVSRTLCAGPVTTVLGELTCSADVVLLGDVQHTPDWTAWTTQLLVRRCKRGTVLQVTHPNAHAKGTTPQLLDAPGLVWSSPQQGVYNPKWTIPNSRQASTTICAPPPARCAVIGAGIAGASVAHALALRGWQVTVYDQHAQPAQGASGLPAGLIVPQMSADDNARSRMSRSGTQLMLQHAQRLLRTGQDWEASGVLEMRDDKDPLWHAQAAWIQPAQLVRAWLQHPGIRFQGLSAVEHLVHNTETGLWTLQTAIGEAIGQAEVVVLANALGSQALLRNLAPTQPLQEAVQEQINALQPTHGTISSGLCHDAKTFPPHPVNGNGCFIPHVPQSDGMRWFAGSTFELDATHIANIAAQHAANHARLHSLLPPVAAALSEAFARGEVRHWSNTRCVTRDRLPLVGPLMAQPLCSLWICAGMGSRGLSFSALCAELLAARMGNEPLPLEASLARSLDVARVRRKRSPAPVDAAGN